MALAFCLLFLLQLALLSVASPNFVFNVESKFKGRDRSLSDFRAHDARSLSALDFPLAGNSIPSKTGLYYTKIGLGSPSKHYYVQIDTGSDILWVNCAGCEKCPRKSTIGIDLTLFDPKKSSSSKMISCDHKFCTSTVVSKVRGCNPGLSCPYSIEYGDGSTTSGYFVKDNILLDKVSGNLRTSSMTETVIFGCGARQSGELGASDDALDGVLGLGPANTSMVSQLAAAGKAKKMFAQCLDTKTGGGIFTIGEVVDPEITTIPLVPNRTHYNVVLKDIEIGSEVLRHSANSSDAGKSREVIVDSGTTLAYLPDDIYVPLIAKITRGFNIIKLSAIEDFVCFNYAGSAGSISETFPTVKFHFDNSLTLAVAPADYLFPLRKGTLCIGWQSSGTESMDGKPIILLGDIVLANKLIVYDLENQAIGWTEYDCSSKATKVRDGEGKVHVGSSHDITSYTSHGSGTTRKTSFLPFILIVMLFDFLF